MTAPRRLQLRRGNTAATSTYVGAPGELVVNTTTNTLFLHDGSTVGGFATTTNTASITNQISSVNANITLANTGMQGYVNLANTIQSAQLTSANLGIIGYVDLANTIQSAQVGAANLAITAANLGMKGYVDSVASQSIYGNGNVKSYLTQFDGNIVPSANAVYSLGSVTNQWKSLFVSNNTIFVGGVPLGIDTTGNLTINGTVIPTISYVNTVVANVVVDLSAYALNANVTAANVGLKGYVDQANTIQSNQLTSANLGIVGYIDLANTIQSAQVGAANLAITAANVGMKGYVDNQITTITGSAPAILDTLGELANALGADANLSVTITSQIANVNANITTANLGMRGYVDSQSFYSNVKVATYLQYGSISNISVAGNVTATYFVGNGALLTGIAASSNYSNIQVATYLPTYSGNIAANISKAGYTWTFGTNGTTQFPNSLILAPAGESITMQSDNYSQLMWENANLTVAPNMAINSNFYVTQNNATLDIGYRDGSSTQLIKSWYWNVDGNLKLPSGGYILNSDDSIYGGGDYSNVQVATYLPTYSGVVTASNVAVAGNVTAQYLFGNGALLTGIVAGSSYSNVQVETYLPTYAGTVSASLVNTSGNILSSGLSVFGNTRIGLAGTVSGQFHSVVGNITQTSSGGAVYINTTGNVLAAAVVTGAVTSTGTVAVNAATGITTNQATFLLANATATTINMGGAATTINLGSTASATGNVFVGGQIGSNAYNLTLRANGRYNTATSIDSNGGFNSPPYANQLVIGGTGTGMTANYSAVGGYLTTLTIYNSGTGYRNGDVISVPGGIAGNSFVLQNYSSGRVGAFTGTALYTFGIDGNLIVPGNVSATTFVGSGALLTSLPGYAYGNVNVAAYLNATGYNLYSNVNVANYLTTATITTTGNITAGNLITGGALYVANITTTGASGNISGANYITANVILTNGGWGNISQVANIQANAVLVSGNITATYFLGNGALLTGIVAGSSYSNVQVATYLPTYAGTVSASLVNSSGNILSTGLSVFGNTRIGSLATPGALHTIIGNVDVSGAGTEYFNIGGNIMAIQASFGSINTTGNITAQNLIGNISITGNVTGTSANVTLQAGAYTSVFDNQGNVRLPTAYVTGNVTANYFVGNGALLTGIAASSTYSNVQVATYLPTYSGVVGASNVFVSGNVTAQYFLGNGALLTGIASSYSNVQVATYLPTYTGNIANVRLSSSGALTFPDGTQQTTAAFGGGGNYGNANVAAFLPTYTGTTGITAVGTLVTLSVTGNTTVGNLVGTEANTRIIANVYTTTFDIYGNVSFPGNIITPTGLYVGPTLFTALPNTIAQFTGNANSYAQINFENLSSGTDATADYVATANNGTDTTFFVDLGIANSNYDNTSPNNSLGTAVFANDSYLYAQGNLATTTGGNLVIGTSTANKSVKIFAGGINSANIVATVSNTGVAVTGNVSATNFVGSGSLLSGVATKITGSWTVPTGNSTQSFTIPDQGAYQLWVIGNIPNGIISYNATATITNSNVPVVGAQYAWVYNGGGTPIDFTSIPNQFTGTGNTIVRSTGGPSATTNRFDFGISNTSGGNVTVSYGYVKIS
jgi:hypothetical protein